MKILALLFLLAGIAAAQPCGRFSYNPLTRRFDCTGAAPEAPIRTINFSIGDGAAVIPTGQYQLGQAGNFACTIIGWSITGKESSGSISIDLDAKASSAPPSAPAIPDTTTDKVSAAAPIAISAAQSAAGGTSAVSTWTRSRVAYDSYAINITSVSTFTQVTGKVWCQ
jgi:hypothetical protein